MLIDTSMKIILGMLFLALSNANFLFDTKKLTWRSYTTTKALPTTNKVGIIDKKKFAKAVLDENLETFIVHVAALDILTAIPINSSKAFQVQDDLTLAALQ